MNFLFFILGLCPIIWLIIALIGLKIPTFKAAFGSLVISAVLALIVWKLPIGQVTTAALEGFLMALWPIILVIIAAVFTYNLSLKTGGMEIIKQMIASVSNDKRILVLLVAWCFGGFMEGMAGFGTAIAIPASMLVGLGFDPLFSCLVCLIANGVPTPYGSIGIPTVTLANLVGLENTGLAAMQTIQLFPFIILCPILIVMVTGGGFKAMKGVWGVTLASGISFAIPQLIVANFVGAELAVVVGSVCSLLVTVLLASKKETDPNYAIVVPAEEKITASRALKAWSPFLFIFIFLLLTSKLVAPINTYLAQFSSTVTVYSGKDPNTLTFSWINTPGVWIFLSAIIGGCIQKASLHDFTETLGATIKQMSETMITMLCVLGCAKIMGYSGMIADIAAFAIAVTGSFYPFFAPWIGALGTFVTGSGTNSGVLFGAVQKHAADTLKLDPYWVVALNSLGVAAGKMLSPQSIAIALSSVDAKGQDSKLLSMIMPYGIVFLIIMSFIAYFGAQMV
ncbi:L-lactate permease [Catenisphaera adipataccumulans]|jgi:lactate permease|uniref:L-lactate permease n=1 Tax=Catenisphaera adipataccumulans TaxID=700500 RepID=A0A7W8FXG6_9FIRM|nr:L-lactate permease [Catenisphaera adipataccumulans]MBB5182917.1 lactate permease [Catenisphaera adipataccumulans]